MANTNATYSRSVTVDLPDYASQTITFYLVSSIAIASNSETFPQKKYTLTLDANGTGTQVLPTPDNTGDNAWKWRVDLPDNKKPRFTLSYDASSISLGTLLTAEASTTTASELTALLQQYLPLAGGTMTGELIANAIITANQAIALQGNLTTTGTTTWSSTDDVINIRNLVDRAEVVSATISGATYSLDPTTGRKFNLTLQASTTITVGTTGVADGDSITIALIQDNVGSRTVAWNTVVWGDNGEPTISTAIGAQDFIVLWFHIDRWYGSLVGTGY